MAKTLSSAADSTPRCIWNPDAQLAEGPAWDPRDRSVYFVDILGKAIHRWQASGQHQSWSAPAEPGFIFPGGHGDFVCGLRGGLYHFEPETGAFELLMPVERDQPRHRLNDGFVDGTGRLWFGSMNEDTQTEGGALYSLEQGPALRVHDTGYIVTNGPAMSPDGGTLYHSDSARRTVYAFDHSAGTLSQRRPYIQFEPGVYPDGMATDSAGNLWIALFNGWRLEQYSPRGRKIAEIRFPCANVTKPAFGGDDLRTLYVTTACVGLTARERAEQPLAGGLFAARVPVAGLRPNAVTIPSPHQLHET